MHMYMYIHIHMYNITYVFIYIYTYTQLSKHPVSKHGTWITWCSRLATRNLKRPEFSVHPTLEMDLGIRETVVSTSPRIRCLQEFHITLVILEIGRNDDRWVRAMSQESSQWGVFSIRVMNAQKMTFFF